MIDKLNDTVIHVLDGDSNISEPPSLRQIQAKINEIIDYINQSEKKYVTYYTKEND